MFESPQHITRVLGNISTNPFPGECFNFPIFKARHKAFGAHIELELIIAVGGNHDPFQARAWSVAPPLADRETEAESGEVTWLRDWGREEKARTGQGLLPR